MSGIEEAEAALMAARERCATARREEREAREALETAQVTLDATRSGIQAARTDMGEFRRLEDGRWQIYDRARRREERWRQYDLMTDEGIRALHALIPPNDEAPTP